MYIVVVLTIDIPAAPGTVFLSILLEVNFLDVFIQVHGSDFSFTGIWETEQKFTST